MVLQTDYGQSTTDFLYGMSEKWSETKDKAKTVDQRSRGPRPQAHVDPRWWLTVLKICTAKWTMDNRPSTSCTGWARSD